jgi:hypothetical protein
MQGKFIVSLASKSILFSMGWDMLLFCKVEIPSIFQFLQIGWLKCHLWKEYIYRWNFNILPTLNPKLVVGNLLYGPNFDDKWNCKFKTQKWSDLWGFQ